MLKLHLHFWIAGCAIVAGCASPPPLDPVPTPTPGRFVQVTPEMKTPESESHGVHPVSHVEAKTTNENTLTIDGNTYSLTLLPPASPSNVEIVAAGHQLTEVDETHSLPIPIEVGEKTNSSLKSMLANVEASDFEESEPVENIFDVPNSEIVQINLPSVLATIDCEHPIVGFAQWRVKQAYAELEQAESLWLPSIQAGFSFHRHDGNYQASNGAIVDVNRNSFQYGLGVGATGAGTTQRPGIVARFHLADAIFQPKVLERQAWARGHAAGATLNRQLLRGGHAYMELLAAAQNQRIVEQARQRLADLAKLTRDLADAGEGLESDAERLQTELVLIENRLIASQERVAVGSANLAQAISLDPASQIVPLDANAVPLHIVAIGTDNHSSLIGVALATRPELKESQALVAAACQAYQREKYAPFVPSVLLGFSGGGFGGGLGNELDDVSDRYDFDALMSWEVRNLGFGERAARRRSSAQIQQAKYEKLRLLDQVARETSQALTQVRHRNRQVELTRGAIVGAKQSYEKNLERIRDGLGLPLEVLQSAEALERAERAYLQAVISYNRAQLTLQWALGWTVDGIEQVSD